jgi:DnaJ family protein C protein 17
MGDELKDQDHYLILGIETIEISSVTTEQIAKAYRKKALKYHPDKNKHKSEAEKAEAASMFQKISKANEVLGDTEKRAAYDNIVNARKARKRKEMEMNADRKKMTDDLRSREEAYKAAQELKRRPAPEPEDLSWLNKNKPFRMPKGEAAQTPPEVFHAVKAKWSKKKKYSKEEITSLFSKFGEIDFVILGEEKRKGRPNALISFKNPQHAQAAIQNKIDGFKLSWPSKDATPTPPAQQTPTTPFFSPFSSRPYGASPFTSPFTSPNYKSPFASPFGSVPSQAASSPADLEDLEMQTLMRLQKAAKLQKEQEQKAAQPQPQTPTSTPAPPSTDNTPNNNGSYHHPLNFDSPASTPSSTPTKDKSTPNSSQYTPNYFHPTDFESLDERNRRHAIERQRLIDELAGKDEVVNS